MTSLQHLRKRPTYCISINDLLSTHPQCALGGGGLVNGCRESGEGEEFEGFHDGFNLISNEGSINRILGDRPRWEGNSRQIIERLQLGLRASTL